MSDVLRTIALCVIALFWCSTIPDTSFAGLQSAANPTAAAYEAFSRRVDDYMTLQKKLARSLPGLPGKPTPQQLVDHQRALATLLTTARPRASKGDVFGKDVPVLIRQSLAPLFKGPEGARTRALIMEEPHPVVPAVNVRYPDEVPLSTMPPDVLKALPTLVEGLEFRFVGRHLILLDVQSHLIVDVVENAIPA
jgi:hypothetical protein